MENKLLDANEKIIVKINEIDKLKKVIEEKSKKLSIFDKKIEFGKTQVKCIHYDMVHILII